MTQKSTKKPHITIHRKEYTTPAYWVNTVEMGFDLDPAATRVATRITLQRNSASPNKDVELLGDGVKQVALQITVRALPITLQLPPRSFRVRPKRTTGN